MKNRKSSRIMVDVLPNNHNDENDVGEKKREDDDTVLLTYSSSSDDNNSVVAVNNKKRNNNRRRQQQQKSSKSQQQGSSSSKSSKQQEQRKRDKRGSGKTNSRKKVSATSRKSHKREKITIETSRYVALDCEMVGIIGESGEEESSLARVYIVDWDGKTLLDVYVQQRQDVFDYRTHVSGIIEEQLTLESGAITFEECQRRVQNVLDDKIIVGHALKNDFQALKLQRNLKWYNIRDTAKYEPFMKVKEYSESNILLARKLKDLMKEHYGRDIQIPGIPHCPREDAIAALALYKKVRYRWEKSMEYKIQKTKEIELRNKQQQQQ